MRETSLFSLLRTGWSALVRGFWDSSRQQPLATRLRRAACARSGTDTSGGSLGAPQACGAGFEGPVLTDALHGSYQIITASTGRRYNERSFTCVFGDHSGSTTPNRPCIGDLHTRHPGANAWFDPTSTSGHAPAFLEWRMISTRRRYRITRTR